MFCMKCGTQLPGDAAFCYRCGAAVIGIPQREPNINNKPQEQLNNRSNIVKKKTILKSHGYISLPNKKLNGTFTLTNISLKFLRHPEFNNIPYVHTTALKQTYLLDSFTIPLQEITQITPTKGSGSFFLKSVTDLALFFVIEDYEHNWVDEIFKLVKNKDILNNTILARDIYVSEGEKIILADASSIIKENGSKESLRMVLTDKRLLFIEAHNMKRIQPGESMCFAYTDYRYEVPLDEIIGTDASKKGFRAYLEVTLNDGTLYNFEVMKKEIWKQEIDKAVKKIREGK